MSEKTGKTWKRRRARARSSLFAAGEPMIWLTGGALVICAAMVAGLLLLVLWKGMTTFWPSPVVREYSKPITLPQLTLIAPGMWL